VAVKSEPGGVYSVKAEAGAAPAIGLSWPSQQFQPTFQVQVQQPVQFSFQPGGFPSSGAAAQLQYTGAAQSLQTIESLAVEAARNAVG